MGLDLLKPPTSNFLICKMGIYVLLRGEMGAVI